MSSVVTASIVVQFSGSDGGILTAEIDDRPTGYNKGKTSFAPGDAPVFLLYKSDDVIIDDMIVSLTGVTLQNLGEGETEITDEVQFANVAEGSLSKPYLSGLNVQWLGRSLGSLVVSQQSKVLAPNPGVAIARVKYQSRFTAYRMLNVPSNIGGVTDFSVLVFISGHTE